MEMLEQKLQDICLKFTKKHQPLQVMITSNQLSHPFVFSTSDQNQVFHSASVGKLTTMIVIMNALKKYHLTLDTPISQIIDQTLLEGLFIYRGVDYSAEVKLRHLLSHTSGINDYFEGKSKKAKPLLKQIIANPNQFFSPQNLLDFTRNFQEPVAVPGKKFYYSDSGYVLLGLIAERLYEKPFHQILRDVIFDPLGMKHTGLCCYDPMFDKISLAPVMINGVDFSKSKALSIDFSGGGLFTTTEDLTTLLQAIHQRTILSEDAYQMIFPADHYFRSGMFYGLGIMEMQFDKLFFLLKGFPRLVGHTGILGVHAWLDPQNGNTYVINISNMNHIASSYQLLITFLSVINQRGHLN